MKWLNKFCSLACDDDTNTPKKVIALGPCFTIHATETGKPILCAEPSLYSAKIKVIDFHEQLKNRITAGLAHGFQRPAYKMLACSLERHLKHDLKKDEILPSVYEIENYIAGKINKNAQTVYLNACILTMILIIGAALYAHMANHIHAQFMELGMIFGTIGAFVSAAQRISNFSVTGVFTDCHIRLMAFTKIMIGSIFGLITILVLGTGMINIGNFQDLQDLPSYLPHTLKLSDQYHMMVLAFLGGLTERFIPEPLNKAAPLTPTPKEPPKEQTPAGQP